MIVYKDKRFISNSEYPDTDWVGDADYILNDNDEKDAEIEAKIIELYPNFELVISDDGSKIVDVVEIEPQPVPPAITQEQRLTAAENAIEEIINLIMEG